MRDFARRANYKKIDLENYKKECRHVGSARLCRLLPTGRKKSDKFNQIVQILRV